MQVTVKRDFAAAAAAHNSHPHTHTHTHTRGKREGHNPEGRASDRSNLGSAPVGCSLGIGRGDGFGGSQKWWWEGESAASRDYVSSRPPSLAVWLTVHRNHPGGA